MIACFGLEARKRQSVKRIAEQLTRILVRFFVIAYAVCPKFLFALLFLMYESLFLPKSRPFRILRAKQFISKLASLKRRIDSKMHWKVFLYHFL